MEMIAAASNAVAGISASRDPETGIVLVVVREGAGKEASITMTAAEWQDWIWKLSPHHKPT